MQKYFFAEKQQLIAIPIDQYGRITGRSGLSLKHKINVRAGLVNSDFRGKILHCSA